MLGWTINDLFFDKTDDHNVRQVYTLRTHKATLVYTVRLMICQNVTLAYTFRIAR